MANEIVPWENGPYVRKLLDEREKWITVLSLTAIAALVVFLSNHHYPCWLNVFPLGVGLIAFVYLLLVGCYYEQAERIQRALVNGDADGEKETRAHSIFWFAKKMGPLGWVNLFIPLIVGILATSALFCGITPRTP